MVIERRARLAVGTGFKPVPTLIIIILVLMITLAPVTRHAEAQSTDVDAILDAIIDAMTLEQKVGQMFLVGLFGEVLNQPNREFLQRYQPGGVALFESNAGNPGQITRLTNDWQQTVINAGGVPMFIATDQEGGVIARLKEGFTTWPVPMLLTASGSLEMAQKVGAAMANELSAVGVNMNLAPVADLYTNLRNPVIGRRSFGSDPILTGRMLAATIRGMQAGGILATAKHFPGHGDTDQDSHTSFPAVNYPRESLDSIELEPFRWTVSAGVESIMAAHIWYPAFDPGEAIPASLSPNVITGLLRGEMGFKGLIMTDAIEMDAIDTQYSLEEASIRAILAGVDIVAFGAHTGPQTQGRTMDAVVNAVRGGVIPESRIDDSVRRILSAKQRYGVLDWAPLDPATATNRMNTAVHAQLVSDLFYAGTTLAYDKIGAIPVPSESSVTVVYPSSRGSIRTRCEPLHNRNLTRWVSVSDTPTAGEIASAVNAASISEVVIVFTQNAEIISAQQNLVNALPAEKTVAVALFSPYDWQAFPDVSAYLTTYSPLDPGVQAVCDILFGEATAQGELPVALDGVRDFAQSAITVERTAIAAAPTENLRPDLIPTLTAVAITQTPQPTATITPSREPLQGATRIGQPALGDPLPTNTPSPTSTLTPTATLTVTATATNTQLPSATPELTEDAPTLVAPTLVALVPPDDTASIPPPVTGDAPASGTDGLNPIFFVIGGVLVVLFSGYGGLYVRGSARTKRFNEGFLIKRCPACGKQALKVRIKRSNTFGIPSARYRVDCNVCKSTLRDEGGGQWRYRINPRVNPRLHERFHDRILDEKTLKALERQRN